MPPQNPDAMADVIAHFMQTAQMRVYTEQVKSFEETVRALQADNQEVDSLKATVKSLQDHYHQEITRLQNTVKSLRDSNEKAGADIATLRDSNNKAAADITQLREEIAELRAQRHRTEASPASGGSPRGHGTRQSAMQLQEQSGRQSLHSRFVRNKTELQLLPRHETNANIRLHPFHEDSDNHAAGPDRTREQHYPRGIKRSHADDVTETRPGHTTAEETSDSHGFEQPQSQKTRHTKRPDHKRVNDEVPNREESRHSGMEDHSRARHDEFVAYYKSKRNDYKKATVTRDKGALVRDFIKGIVDPAYCRWFQNALQEQFPERVRNTAHPTGKIFISVPRDLTWEDAKTVVRDRKIP